MTESEWDQLMGVNLKGVFLCSKAAIPAMRVHRNGTIINIASELGVIGAAGVAAYCASKGGVVQLSKAMAIDDAEDGIRVNCLCPGPITTELLENVFASSLEPEKMRKGFEERTILNRLGRPDEIAAAAVFLASRESSFMTGANLIVDGGWTAQ
jgi:NAD(P)-dependent dehydrogenase (short-subunit alcohol dehydrogenase family)